MKSFVITHRTFLMLAVLAAIGVGSASPPSRSQASGSTAPTRRSLSPDRLRCSLLADRGHRREPREAPTGIEPV